MKARITFPDGMVVELEDCELGDVDYFVSGPPDVNHPVEPAPAFIPWNEPVWPWGQYQRPYFDHLYRPWQGPFFYGGNRLWANEGST